MKTREISRETAAKITALMQAGRSLKEAMDAILPDKDSAGKKINTNKWRNVRKWQALGLIPRDQEPSEMVDASITTLPISQDSVESAGRPEPPFSLQEETARGLAVLYESGFLTEMFEQWKSGKALEEMDSTSPRPNIRGKKGRRNTGIAVDREVLERATKKMNRERGATGGSLSQLVELLLWMYVGSPQDLLEG